MLKDHRFYEHNVFDGLKMPSEKLIGAEFEGCQFNHCDFSGSFFQNANS